MCKIILWEILRILHLSIVDNMLRISCCQRICVQKLGGDDGTSDIAPVINKTPNSRLQHFCTSADYFDSCKSVLTHLAASSPWWICSISSSSSRFYSCGIVSCRFVCTKTNDPAALALQYPCLAVVTCSVPPISLLMTTRATGTMGLFSSISSRA